jgi:hypothetical protein
MLRYEAERREAGREVRCSERWSGVTSERAKEDGKARHMKMSSADRRRVFATEGSRKHVNITATPENKTLCSDDVGHLVHLWQLGLKLLRSTSSLLLFLPRAIYFHDTPQAGNANQTTPVSTDGIATCDMHYKS